MVNLLSVLIFIAEQVKNLLRLVLFLHDYEILLLKFALK